MSTQKYNFFLIFPLVLGIILACNTFTGSTPQPATTLNSLYTAAAETLIVMSTQEAGPQAPSVTPILSIFTNPTDYPTVTLVPPLESITKCDAGAFVSDITYPDGSNIGRGNTFTKIWRIRNIGTCTWTTSYDLVFVGGEKFGAENETSLAFSIDPGKTVDLSIQLTAPNQDGHYKGYWVLRNGSGIQFGFGERTDSGIYVDINVSGYTVTGYDFAANFCDARWTNSNKQLACPGADGSAAGFALLINSPKMEDGKVRGAGLLTHPENINNGMISGKYSGIKIQSGDHFSALIGCLDKANDCNITLKLEYQIGNDPVKILGQWSEIYEGKYYPLNIDLGFLNGQKVKFILTTLANGSSHEDYGLWVNPQISRQSSQPATSTPSATSSPTASATEIPSDTPPPSP